MRPDLRPRALFLSPEAPYPVVGGGALRSASIFEYLAARYVVDVIVFREPSAPDPRSAFPAGLARDIHVLDLPFHSRSLPARGARNLVRYLAGRVPLNDRFSGFAAPIASCIGARRYDLALIEHFWCAPYGAALEAQSGRVVLDLHNVESVFYRRCAQAEPWPASMALRRFSRACAALERRWLPRFFLLLAASAEDARRVREISPAARVEVYPNAIPLVPLPHVADRPALIFSGNLEFRPNVSAVRFFRKRIWPLIRECWPGLVWRLVGKNPQAVAKYVAGDPRIELLGPVENAVQALAAARVVVVPLLAGSGTRVKILEAWAAGRPVVSTSLGAEGLPAIDGEHLLLADNPEEFAAAVSRLLASPQLRDRVGRAGRQLYESQFTWPQAWERLAAIGI
jgi:glycosyltransferase involved in cell wall biosynthesis